MSFNRHFGKKKGGNKYNARRMFYDGIMFDSKGECRMYQLLRLREKAGEIRDIELQVSVSLCVRNVVLRVDFRIFDIQLDQTIYVEFKGFETAPWITKRNLWAGHGPGRMDVYQAGRKSDDFPRLWKTIVPKKELRIVYD